MKIIFRCNAFSLIGMLMAKRKPDETLKPAMSRIKGVAIDRQDSVEKLPKWQVFDGAGESGQSHVSRITNKLFAAKPAFSLIEMLMALLVASLLLVALAPVVTKRIEDKVSIKGDASAGRTKTVYLTDVGTHDWTVPQGITNFTVTTVGAGGGGGNGMNYGCVVFTTTAVAQNSILSDDTSYCTHVRGDNDISFTIPEGIEEFYVSLVGGGGGGGSGKGVFAPQLGWYNSGTYNWDIPAVAKGDRILIKMNGGGGGGGGSDQGGGGGGASGYYMNWTPYNIPVNKNTASIIIGGGGHGGYYWNSPGKGGYNGGNNGMFGSGSGGGGGASSFDNIPSLTVAGGGGGASAAIGACGWAGYTDVWKTVYNHGGNGRSGGISGPYASYGGKSGGDGAPGGGIHTGGDGQDGNVSAEGGALGSARGGQGGGGAASGNGNGGKGQDQCAIYTGGAGGGGGGSAWSKGSSAPAGCSGTTLDSGNKVTTAKAGTGAGGGGGSCGWNYAGSMTGGDGGDGVMLISYLENKLGGWGGQAGPVVPRSRVSLANSIKAGSIIVINLGKGGTGGDRMIAYPNNNNVEIRTMNSSSSIMSSTSLANANGKSGTGSIIKFGSGTIATTGGGGCGGGYDGSLIGPCGGYGTTQMDGSFRNPLTGSWHGQQSAACAEGMLGGADNTGTSTKGGNATMLVFDDEIYCGKTGGILTSKNGSDGEVGRGGSGAYYGGFGGKGADGYVKIEWGIPRNINKTASVKYSGGGGSAGEFVTSKIQISPITKKIRYTIGEGGNGAIYDILSSKITDGSNGGSTIFGIDENYKLSAKGGRGGKSAKVNSTYDSYFTITALTGTQGLGGISDCTLSNPTKCKNTMNGFTGLNGQGGRGGNSFSGEGATGGNSSSPNGNDAANFDGHQGGGGGGGGGAAKNQEYGKGGKGGNGYIKIQWND